MNKKQRLGLIFFFLLIYLLVCPFRLVAQEAKITSNCAVVIDAETGAILYAKNHLEQRPPASTTKVLTSILAIEQAELERVVKISAKAEQTGEASINLLEGESMTMENLLYGALLKSGNDACVALAEAIAPSVEDFVELMNMKSKLLGCTNTNFVNTNGLPDERHYSTALDLALISRYALNNPTFRKIVATKEKTINWENSYREKYLQNTNRLLEIYPGAMGVKTGTTDKAGKCLIAAANRKGRIVIAVVLKSYDRFGDAIKLLDYGLNNYYNQEIIQRGQIINCDQPKLFAGEPVLLQTKENLVLTLRKGEKTNITYKIMQKDIACKKDNDESIGLLQIYNYHQKIAVLKLYPVVRTN